MEARRIASAKEAAAVEQQCIEYEAMRVAYNSKEYADEVRAAVAALKAESEAKAQAKADAAAAAAAAAPPAADEGGAPSPARAAPSFAWGLAIDLASDALVDDSLRIQRGHTTAVGSDAVIE